MAPLLAPGRDRAAREDEDGCEARGDRKVLAVAVDGRAGGRAAPGLSCSLPAGPETPSGEEEARADQRELAGAAAAAGGRRGEAGGRAPRGCGRAGVAVRPRLTDPPHRALPPAQVQAKLENAEVLELTVRRVQGALRGRARGEWRRGARAGARSPGLPLPGTEEFPSWSRARPPRLLGEPCPRGPGGPGHSNQLPLTEPGAALSPPTPEHRTRAAAGGSKRALRRRLHPVHARGAHVRVNVPGNRRYRRRRAPEPPARVHAAARGQQLPGSARGRPVRATGSPWAEQLASRRRPGVPTAQPPGLRGRPVLRPGGGPRG